ncbi:MAG TPA: ABC transporter ATP-binding protein [Mycobacteriales bacterium]|nr:ABC transporter ATP-binding protein [Mycobacteriales bacterium]
MATIELSGLTKRFGDQFAVKDLTVTVEPGSVVGFLGPNGAGKTTTLRMLLGLVTPTTGSALIDGVRYADLSEPRHVVGAVLEASGAHPARTARRHLRIEAVVAAAPPGRVDAVLDLVGLHDAADRRVGTFSLGMRQRLGLATALLCDPDVLILDEPANGLDPEGVRWLRTLLRGLAEQGRTVLVSSHLLAEVAQTVDSVVIINRGRLVRHAALDELVSEAEVVVRVRTSDPAGLRKAVAAPGVTVTETGGEVVEIVGATPEHIGRTAADKRIPIFDINTETFDLEQLFLGLTGSTSGIGEAS